MKGEKQIDEALIISSSTCFCYCVLTLFPQKYTFILPLCFSLLLSLSFPQIKFYSYKKKTPMILEMRKYQKGFKRELNTSNLFKTYIHDILKMRFIVTDVSDIWMHVNIVFCTPLLEPAWNIHNLSSGAHLTTYQTFFRMLMFYQSCGIQNDAF